MVEDIIEGRIRTFQEVRASIEQRMRSDRERARLDEFLAGLRGRTSVEVNEKLLLEIGKVKEKPKPEDKNQRP